MWRLVVILVIGTAVAASADSSRNSKNTSIHDYLSKKFQKSNNFEVNFILYTKKNPRNGQNITINDSTLSESNFDPTFPTRFIIHGWTQDASTKFNFQIRDQYLKRGDFNVFIVGWEAGADTINYIKAALINVKVAGKKLSAFVDFLIAKGNLDANNTYFIGHSLGAHVAGIGGKTLTLGRINTIFGLDAALPLFFNKASGSRLAKGDALYVETIHTDSETLGYYDPLGNSSFYPNYGSDQPGCGIDLTTSCSHHRSTVYFAESLSIPNEFVAVRCSGFSEIKDKSCNISGPIARMGGEPSNYGRSVEGIYYLPVNSKSPYATGTV